MKAVLLDPITSPGTPGSTSVFVIQDEGGGVLRAQDLYLHFACAVTQSDADDISRYHQDVGAAGAIRELRVLDSKGRRLYHVREGAQIANWHLLSKRTSAAQRDVDNRMLHNRRAMRVLPNGTFRRSGDMPLLTAAAGTTPRAMIPLSLLCPMFRGLLPLRNLGPLRIEITWQTQFQRFIAISAADGTAAAGTITNFAFSAVQLTYSMFVNQQAEAVYSSLGGSASLEYEEPRLATQALNNAAGDYSVPIGAAGEKVSGVLIAAVDNNALSNTGAYSFLASSLVNLRVNGRRLFPVDLDRGAVLSQTEMAAGGVTIPLGGYDALTGNNLGMNGQVFAARNNYKMISLKQAPHLPASALNSTECDSSGIYLNLTRTAGAVNAQTVYGYAMVQKAIAV
jgi:hypothetical protein